MQTAKVVKITVPLWLNITKKKKKLIPISITWYRNAHYQTLNKVKQQYAEELVIPQLKNHSPMTSSVYLLFVLYVRDRSRLDLDNYTGVHKKFFMDALVTHKIISDDSVFNVPLSVEVFGGIDKQNPRLDIYLSEDLNLIGKLSRKLLCQDL